MTERGFEPDDSDDADPVLALPRLDLETQNHSKVPQVRPQNAPPRSRTDPDLFIRVASSEESLAASSRKFSRTVEPNHAQRMKTVVKPPLDSRWIATASSSDTKSVSQGETDLTDVDPSRGILFNNINETNRQSPIIRNKSPSTSHLNYVRNSGSYNKQTRYGRNSSGMNQNYSGIVPSQYAMKPMCSCCENAKRATRAESVLSLADDPETPEGLSWRRLHMSRAKLKATATTSELLSGFAMVAMVELQINKPTAVPEWLFVTFAVCTTILVSVHIFALMISTYLLPSIDAVSKLHVSSLVTESPHDRMKTFIELAWAFSTILGLLLFLVEIAILCWVKFWDYSFTAAMSATMIVIPVLIVFVAFAMHFYHSLVVIKCKTSVNNIQQLEDIKKQLDSVA